jgi:hypothetical protein
MDSRPAARTLSGPKGLEDSRSQEFKKSGVRQVHGPGGKEFGGCESIKATHHIILLGSQPSASQTPEFLTS